MPDLHSMFLFPIWPGASNSHYSNVLPVTYLHKTYHTDIHASDTSHGRMAWFLQSVFTNYLDTNSASHCTIHPHCALMWLTMDHDCTLPGSKLYSTEVHKNCHSQLPVKTRACWKFIVLRHSNMAKANSILHLFGSRVKQVSGGSRYQAPYTLIPVIVSAQPNTFLNITLVYLTYP